MIVLNVPEHPTENKCKTDKSNITCKRDDSQVAEQLREGDTTNRYKTSRKRNEVYHPSFHIPHHYFII
jgi:hypothetical protein